MEGDRAEVAISHQLRSGDVLQLVLQPDTGRRVAHAHCDLYCGVYDPAQAKIEALSCLKTIQKYHDSDDEHFKTRAIIINTPNNPTGKVFTRDELTVIADLCRRHDVLCITDEIYEYIIYGGAEHIPLASLDGMADRTTVYTDGACSGNPGPGGWAWVVPDGAFAAGFDYAKGQIIVTIDADRQNDPADIPVLVAKFNEGFDVVNGWRQNRQDGFLLRKVPSYFANRMIARATGVRLHDRGCSLRAYSIEVARDLHLYGEMHRYIPVICKWHGFGKIGEKVVQHQARKYGTTKYGLERFITGFLDLISVTFVSKFRKKPMHFFGTLGSLSFIGGFIIAAYVIFQKIWNIYNSKDFRDVVDQPLFYLALVAIIIGVQLFLAGFLAEMYTMANEKNSKYLLIDKVGF